MRILTRSTPSVALPSASDIEAHMRIHIDQMVEAYRYVTTAMREIEDHANLALFTTTLTAISQADPGTSIRLPIGPLLDDSTLIATAIAEDGTETALTPTLIVTGNWPEFILDTAPEWRVKATWTAGYGTTWANLPDDLQHAVLDQALVLFDERGANDMKPGLCPAAARISARYARVVIHA